jgi:rhodanese-related sulfurtransferase
MRTGLHIFLMAALAAAVCAGCAASTADEPIAAAPDGAPDGARAQAPAYVRDLAPEDFRDYLLSRTDAFVLDVRQTSEWDDDLGHLAGANLIPAQDLEGRLGELPRDKSHPIAVYDRIGVRSLTAAQLLTQHGWREVVTLMGGLAAYRRAGL